MNLFAKPSFPVLVPEIPFPGDSIVTCRWDMVGYIDMETAIMLGLLRPSPEFVRLSGRYGWVSRCRWRPRSTAVT